MRIRTLLVATALGLCATACDGCADDTPTTTTTQTAKAPVAAPEGLAATIVVRSPQQLLGDVRAASGGPALFLPRSVGGTLVNLLGLPLQAAELIDEQLPIVAASAVGSAGEIHVAAAVHVRDRGRLQLALTGGKDARFEVDADGDVTYFRAKPALREARLDATLALVDHHLVAASDRAAVTRLGPYLTRTLAAAPAPNEDIAIVLKDGAFAKPLRKRLTQLRSKLSAVPMPPAVAVLVDSDATFDAALSLLDDIGGGRVSIELGDALLEIDAELEPRDDAAAKRLAERATAKPSAMLALPHDTVAALSWSEDATSRRHGVAERAKAIASLLGKGWSDEDTAGVEAALGKIADGRGDHTLASLRCTGVGVTGITSGRVADAGALRSGLSALVDTRKHPAVVAKLDEASLKLSAKKTRILHVPHDVWRLRLTPTKEGVDPRLEAIDLLYMVLDDRFVAAAGMETVDSVQHVEAPDEEKVWSTKGAVKASVERLGDRAWLSALVDPQGIHACALGKPGGTLATPVALALGPADGKVVLRLEIARPLIRVAVEQLGF